MLLNRVQTSRPSPNGQDEQPKMHPLIPQQPNLREKAQLPLLLNSRKPSSKRPSQAMPTRISRRQFPTKAPSKAHPKAARPVEKSMRLLCLNIRADKTKLLPRPVMVPPDRKSLAEQGGQDSLVADQQILAPNKLNRPRQQEQQHQNHPKTMTLERCRNLTVAKPPRPGGDSATP